MTSLPPPGSGPGESSWPSYPNTPSGPAPAPGYGGPSYDQGSAPPAYGGYVPSTPPGYQAYAVPEYASFGQRLGAAIIDGLVNLLIMLPFLIGGFFLLRNALEDCFTNSKDQIECPPGALKGGPLALAIAIFVAGLVVAVIIHCRWVGRSQTPGQKALNIRVLDANTGQPIGTGRAFGRYLFKSLISGTVCYLGYLWMLWDSKRQTWHDKVANSVVVRV